MEFVIMTGEAIADIYEILIATLTALGMDEDAIQKQLTVYGRVPFQIHKESLELNEKGKKEKFVNNPSQVTIRLDSYYCTGHILGGVARDQDHGIVLLVIEECQIGKGRIQFVLKDRNGDEVYSGFKPKSVDKLYPIGEAFQTLEGDFTARWSSPPFFFEGDYRLNYPGIFRDKRFLLYRFLDVGRFRVFVERVVLLKRVVEEMSLQTARLARDFFESREEYHTLISLIDCGTLREDLARVNKTFGLG